MEVSTSLRRQRNTTNYSDQELYETFGLSKTHINIIETIVKERK